MVAFFAIPVRVFRWYYATPQYYFSTFTIFYHPFGRIPVLYENYVLSGFAFWAFFWFSIFGSSHFPLILKPSLYIQMPIYFGCPGLVKNSTLSYLAVLNPRTTSFTSLFPAQSPPYSLGIFLKMSCQFSCPGRLFNGSFFYCITLFFILFYRRFFYCTALFFIPFSHNSSYFVLLFILLHLTLPRPFNKACVFVVSVNPHSPFEICQQNANMTFERKIRVYQEDKREVFPIVFFASCSEMDVRSLMNQFSFWRFLSEIQQFSVGTQYQ